MKSLKKALKASEKNSDGNMKTLNVLEIIIISSANKWLLVLNIFAHLSAYIQSKEDTKSG